MATADRPPKSASPFFVRNGKIYNRKLGEQIAYLDKEGTPRWLHDNTPMRRSKKKNDGKEPKKNPVGILDPPVKSPPALPTVSMAEAVDFSETSAPIIICPVKRKKRLSFVTVVVFLFCLAAVFLLLSALLGKKTKNTTSPNTIPTLPMASLDKKTEATPVSPEKLPSEVSGHGFQIEYQLENKPETTRCYLNVIVKGKIKDADEKFALIFTDFTADPNGNSEIVGEVSKSDLLVNGQKKISVLIATPQVGNYALSLKSYKTEEVVCSKNVNFQFEKVLVEDVKFNFDWRPRFGSPSKTQMRLNSMDLSLSKKGNLPLNFKKCILKIESCDPDRSHIRLQTGGLMVNANHQTSFEVNLTDSLARDIFFAPGAKIQVKGTLFFGEKSIDFQQEVVVK